MAAMWRKPGLPLSEAPTPPGEGAVKVSPHAVVVQLQQFSADP